MTRLIIELPNIKDLNLLLPLLERLKIKFSTVEVPQPERKIEDAINIVKAGCDMSSFGNASEFQRAVRKDRELPFRTEQ